MKGSKVRSKELIIGLVLSLFSVSIFAESKICFKNEIPVYCEDEQEEMKSLSGNFYSNSQYYEFSARRAFPMDWCESTLLEIQKVMSKGKFCIVFEEELSESGLTINKVESSKHSWSYFK